MSTVPQEEYTQDTAPQSAIVAPHTPAPERELGTLNDQETLISAIAHEFVERQPLPAIMRFLDIRPCTPYASTTYANAPAPLLCYRCIFELVDTRLVHVIVSERAISFDVDFMFVEENPSLREEARRHQSHWHTSSHMRAVQAKESELHV